MAASVGLPLALAVVVAALLLLFFLALAFAGPDTRRGWLSPPGAASARRRAVGIIVAGGVATLGSRGALHDFPARPFWSWLLMAAIFVALLIAVWFGVAVWAAYRLNQSWTTLVAGWDGRRLPPPVGLQATVATGELVSSRRWRSSPLSPTLRRHVCMRNERTVSLRGPVGRAPNPPPLAAWTLAGATCLVTAIPVFILTRSWASTRDPDAWASLVRRDRPLPEPALRLGRRILLVVVIWLAVVMAVLLVLALREGYSFG
jgi:hypothetical protein